MEQLRILWATDGSEPSKAAIPFLAQLARAPRAHLTVLCVAPCTQLGGARVRPGRFDALTRAGRNEAVRLAHEIAQETLDGCGLEKAGTEVMGRWGNPIEEILNTARKTGSDLIVLGARGHSSIRLLLLGSVAQGVVQNADRPVLVARPGSCGFRRIVAGYDGSPEATKALDFLARLDVCRPKQLVLADVVEPFTLPSGTPAPYRHMAIREAREINESRRETATATAQSALDRYAELSQDSRCEVLEGQPSVRLEQAALAHAADLLLVGSRKPSRVRHYTLGSTAEKLVRHAPVSVLVVRQ